MVKYNHENKVNKFKVIKIRNYNKIMMKIYKIQFIEMNKEKKEKIQNN